MNWLKLLIWSVILQNDDNGYWSTTSHSINPWREHIVHVHWFRGCTNCYLSLPAIPIIIVHYHQPSITWYTNYRELYSAYNYPSSHHVPPLNLIIAAASSDCQLISPSCLWSVPSAVTCHRKCAIMVNFILITFPHLVIPEYYSWFNA